MSAFGKRNNSGGGRPSFGVARPMTGGTSPVKHDAKTANPPPPGGEQFPPIDTLDVPNAPPSAPSDAMNRLSERANSVNETGVRSEGFEASVHKIKEQVLPRLLERVDPEAASTLNKEELTEEFRPIIMEVLAEL